MYASCVSEGERIGDAARNEKAYDGLGLRFWRSAASRPQHSVARLQRIASTLRGSDRALALKMRFSHEVLHIGWLTSQSTNHMGRLSLALMSLAF